MLKVFFESVYRPRAGPEFLRNEAGTLFEMTNRKEAPEAGMQEDKKIGSIFEETQFCRSMTHSGVGRKIASDEKLKQFSLDSLL